MLCVFFRSFHLLVQNIGLIWPGKTAITPEEWMGLEDTEDYFNTANRLAELRTKVSGTEAAVEAAGLAVSARRERKTNISTSIT